MKKLLVLVLIAFLVACGGNSTKSGTTPPATQVTLNTTTASSLVGQTAQFTANVPVTWAVKETNGGTITSGGLYTAPANTGTFHVVATSTGDKTNSATASVDVSAAFLSLQTLPGGAAQPFSVTPMFTTLKSDGTWTTEGVIDPATSKPFDVAAYDLVLSPDGTKAAFTILTPGNDIEGPTFFYNLGIADVATSVITLLTHNENNPGSYAQDVYPQFAPDGKSLVYMHYGYDDATEEWMHSVRTMSIDGSNVQTIHAVLYEGAWSPSYSPDGEMIAFERAGADATGYFDGIATMNKDGGNLVQLTGYEPVNYACWGWDQMPAFTNDGVSITFTRECFPEDGGVSDMLYSMHVDGSSLVQIHGPGYAGTMSCQARTFANNSVAFSSNVNAPGTNSFEMWSVLPDGTKSMQITHNNLYDGFSVYWMNYNTMTASARAFERHSPLHQRMIHKQMTRQHKVLAK